MQATAKKVSHASLFQDIELNNLWIEGTMEVSADVSTDSFGEVTISNIRAELTEDVVVTDEEGNETDRKLTKEEEKQVEAILTKQAQESDVEKEEFVEDFIAAD